MSKKAIVSSVVAALTVMTISTGVLARGDNQCRLEKYNLQRAERSYESDHRDARRLRDKQRMIRNEMKSLNDEIESAERSLRNAKSALNTLRYEYENSDEILVRNTSLLKSAEVELVVMVEKEQELKNKYKKLAKWKLIQRAAARSKWKKQEGKVKDKKAQISGFKNTIARINNVVENFDLLLEQRINAVDRAERRSNEVAIENARKISDLYAEENRLYDRLRRAERDERRSRERLDRARSGYEQCYHDAQKPKTTK